MIRGQRRTSEARPILSGWRNSRDGYRYFTIGATASEWNFTGRVVAGFNRTNDANLTMASKTYKRVKPIKVRTMNRFIRRTDAYIKRHRSAPRYVLFPQKSSDPRSNSHLTGYNSNSYITGLLRATGFRRRGRKPAGKHPGWEKPIPKSYYRL